MALPESPMAGAAGDTDPNAPQDNMAGGGEYEICIRVSTDKKFTVYVERDGAQAAAAPGAEPGDAEATEGAGGMECATIKQALTAALEIYRADGQMPQGADDDFQQGFAPAGAGA